MEKLDNRPQVVEPLQHEIRPKLPGVFISDIIQHHTYIITLKIPQTVNLSYASGNSYYYNIAKNQKCGRKLPVSGKRSSNLLVLFQELLRNHSSFLHACHISSTTTSLLNISPERNMILNGSFH
jgi:hypothetical protein